MMAQTFSPELRSLFYSWVLIQVVRTTISCSVFQKVQEKFGSGADISWNRAMDEVRTERLMTKHGKDTLLVIIRDWPVSEKYKGKPELVASLEYLVCVVAVEKLS